MPTRVAALALLSLGGAVAAATDDWWLIPLGAAAGATLVASSAALDPRRRQLAERVAAAQAALRHELKAVPLELRMLLGVSDRRLAEVARQTTGLVRQHRALEQRAARLSGRKLQRDLEAAMAAVEGELARVEAVLDAATSELVRVSLLPPVERPERLAEALSSFSLALDAILTGATLQ